MSKYDDEIREVELRLMRDRHALAADAENLTATARDMMSSPKGLGIAFAVGFLLGELTAPKRHRRSQTTQAADTTKKVGLGGLIGSALFAYVRSRYGSPWALGRHAWDYYMSTQRARQAAMQRTAPASAGRPTAHPATSSGTSAVSPTVPREVQPVAATREASLRAATERHAAS